MTRRPPRRPCPRLGSPHRTLRNPPVPGTTSRASRSLARWCCSSAYSSSVRYSGTSCVKSGASMNSTLKRAYASCVGSSRVRAWDCSYLSGGDALALASGGRGAPADGGLVRFRVGPELHVQLHGVLELLHGLADVGLERSEGVFLGGPGACAMRVAREPPIERLLKRGRGSASSRAAWRSAVRRRPRRPASRDSTPGRTRSRGPGAG